MIDLQDELKNFKPSHDTDDIEAMIAGMDLTDMNDLVMQYAQKAAAGEKHY